MLGHILLQLNTNLFLQSLGLTIIQAVFTAPVYGLAMYWGILFAIRRMDQQTFKLDERISKLENKN